MSFILTVSWFLFVASIERRVRFPCLFVFPYGDAAQLGSIDGARWIFAPTDVQLSLPFDGRTGSSPEIKGSDQLSIPDGTTGVVADLRADLPWQLEEFLAKCALEGIPVYHSKQVRESLTGRVTIEHLSENTFGSLIPSSVYFPVKRFVDCVVAIGLLPLVAVIGLLVAFAIKMEDGGSVFFKQQRIGYRGRSYTIIKFRTMTEGSERGDLFTADGDKRVTRVGRLLRRYRIDELPQILNILKGEMSWIGPRPESEPLSRWYESKIPFYRYRHIVMPGISGWAQVNQGNVAEIPGATDKLHYDFFYIKNFSASIDALIAIRTIGIVLGGFGAR